MFELDFNIHNVFPLSNTFCFVISSTCRSLVIMHHFLELIMFSYIVGWKVRCSRYFPYSTYFEGCKSSVVARNKVQGADQSLSPPSEDKLFPAVSIGALAKVKLTVLGCKSYDDGMEMIENMSKMSKKHFVTFISLHRRRSTPRCC